MEHMIAYVVIQVLMVTAIICRMRSFTISMQRSSKGGEQHAVEVELQLGILQHFRCAVLFVIMKWYPIAERDGRERNK